MRDCRLWMGVLLIAALAQVLAAGYELGDPAHDGARWVTFRYTPELPVAAITVAGSFNDWSQVSHPMKDPDGDGTYTALLALIPGEYQYKFVLNGETWVTDPDNPEVLEPHENSLLQVLPVDSGARPAEVSTGESLSVRIHYLAPEVQRMAMIWGLDGWHRPPDDLTPEGSQDVADKAVITPMNQIGPGRFALELRIPKGATVDYAFHLIEPVERWDNNGGEGIDYHETIEQATTLRHVAPPSPGGGGLMEMARAYGLHLKGPARLGARMPGIVLFCALTGLLLGMGFLLSKTGDAVAFSGWRRGLVVLWIGLLAFSIRYDHATSNKYEIDEFAYVPIARTFAHALAARDFAAWISEPRTTEHPRLGVEMFAVAIASSGRIEDWDHAFHASRMVSVFLAMLTAMVIAWRWPLAGVLWACSGLGVFYTSIAYLDSTAAFFAVCCLAGFLSARENLERGGGSSWMPWGWLVLSSLAAGMAVSTKYMAAVAPLAVAVGFGLWIVRDTRRRKVLLAVFAGYVVVSLVTMVATDAHLWTPDLLGRVLDRFRFHSEFSQSDLVTNAQFPWYQPLVWMGYFMGYEGRPLWMLIDQAILVLGVAGFFVMLRRVPLIAAAGWITLLFLFLWPTKWPQYEVLLLPWLCIGAEETLCGIRTWAQNRSGPRTPTAAP